MRRLRTLLTAFHKAGGTAPVLLVHDEAHGAPLIDALARYGDGLPADVLPFPVNEVTQVGPETIAAAFAYGASAVRFLGRARPKHDMAALVRNAARFDAVAQALGYGPEAGGPIVSDRARPTTWMRWGGPRGRRPRHARAHAVGLHAGWRRAGRPALRGLGTAPRRAASRRQGAARCRAPFGGLAFKAEACTLCHACVGACPTGALADDPERPRLTFAESACVQCGLCAATCPEDAIGLVPQLDFAAWAAPRRVLKEEEPFDCIACGKAFGTRSTIERVVGRLRDRHWMFAGQAGEERIKALMMCDTCRSRTSSTRASTRTRRRRTGRGPRRITSGRGGRESGCVLVAGQDEFALSRFRRSGHRFGEKSAIKQEPKRTKRWPANASLLRGWAVDVERPPR